MGFRVTVDEADRVQKEAKLDSIKPGWTNTFFHSGVGGDVKDIIFVDDEPFIVWAHQPKVDGTWMTFTCPNENDSACCAEFGRDRKGRPGGQGYGRFCQYNRTIIDTSVYKTRDGKELRNELKLFSHKTNVHEILKAKVRMTQIALKGGLYSSVRTQDKAERVGDQFERVREVDMASFVQQVFYKGKKLTAWFSEAEASAEKMDILRKIFSVRMDDAGRVIREIPTFNYEFILEPPTNQEIADIVRRARSRGPEQPVKSFSRSDDAVAGSDTLPADEAPF